MLNGCTKPWPLSPPSGFPPEASSAEGLSWAACDLGERRSFSGTKSMHDSWPKVPRCSPCGGAACCDCGRPACTGCACAISNLVLKSVNWTLSLKIKVSFFLCVSELCKCPLSNLWHQIDLKRSSPREHFLVWQLTFQPLRTFR